MADDDQIEDEAALAAAGKRRKRKRMLIAGAVLLSLTAAGGGWFFFVHGQNGEDHVEAAAPPVFLDVPEMLVNLANVPGERVQYLKVKVVLEVKDAPLVERIKPTMPRVTDLFQTYLRELRPSDLNGSIGLFRLKEELTRRVNAAISPSQVNAVLFKEIIIQ